MTRTAATIRLVDERGAAVGALNDYLGKAVTVTARSAEKGRVRSVAFFAVGDLDRGRDGTGYAVRSDGGILVAFLDFDVERVREVFWGDPTTGETDGVSFVVDGVEIVVCPRDQPAPDG